MTADHPSSVPRRAARDSTWTVVLAAGEGTRLKSLTTDTRGRAVPKQFCSLYGETSLLQDALRRAHGLVDRSKVCAIVAAQHREWWGGALWALPAPNVIVQPANRGTAIGILLAALAVLARDPFARIVFLPSDHYVRDEPRLATALARLTVQLELGHEPLVLLGIAPEEADPELGYVVPGAMRFGAHAVERFVEKPSVETARRLLADGALWNRFIFAAHGPSLLALFHRHLPAVVDSMETALARDAARPEAAGAALREFYETLPSVDFSRHILAGSAAKLRVVAAPACGWSDLGTPRRVGEALRRTGQQRPAARRAGPCHVPVNLAAAWAEPAIAG